MTCKWRVHWPECRDAAPIQPAPQNVYAVGNQDDVPAAPLEAYVVDQFVSVYPIGVSSRNLSDDVFSFYLDPSQLSYFTSPFL